MRELHSDGSVGLEQNLHSLDEIVQARYLSENIVPEQEIRAPIGINEFSSQDRAKEPNQCWNTFFHRHISDVGRGLDAEGRNVLLDEILQEITIVTGELDHQTVCVQSQAIRHAIGVGLRMTQPRIRIGGKIGVLREDIFWPNIFLELYQETIAADIGTQWIEWLHSVDLVRAEKALTQRRHSQIYKRMVEWRSAESTIQ